MATVRVKSIPVRQQVITLKPGVKIDRIRDALERSFGRLGCPTCLSGLNRLLIVDRIGSRIR